jgi:regulatory protein
MEIKSYKKLKDNKYKVIFKNNEEIVLYDDIILKYNLLLTKKIDEKKLEVIKAENTSLECFYKAIKYLSCKSRSKLEVIKYLKRFNYSLDDINNAITKLEENNYLDDDNYMTSFINDLINLTNNGPKKITNKLINLGFKEEKIKPLIDKIDDNVWQEKVEKIVNKKINADKKEGENKIRERILYNLVNEGFKKEDILLILDNTKIPQNKDALLKIGDKLYNKLTKKYEGSELWYQLKAKLIQKGFNYNEVEEAIDKIKNMYL